MKWQGIAAAPGIAVGTVRLLREEAPPERRSLLPQQLAAELERLDAALKQAEAQLGSICASLIERGRADEAEIFEGHLLFLQDEELIGRARQIVQEEGVNAEYAVHSAMQETVSVIEALDDAYLRERAADIRDVMRRVIRILSGGAAEEAGSPAGEKIVWIADELSPSDTAKLNPQTTAGFASAAGGRTSHSAILARSLGIPAVVGLGSRLLDELKDGQTVIVDGMQGELLVDPSAEQLAEYRQKAGQLDDRKALYEAFLDRPTTTLDGAAPELVANIGTPQDAATAAGNGAEGIGLFRTEFLYMGREHLPTEEEQTEVYTAVVRAFGPGAPVVIRTMDIGGDKELPLLELPKEDNPFLGYRAIRICLDRPELFRTQLRAVLRASAEGNVKLMFPMIATMSEWRQAKARLGEAKAELKAEGVPFNPELETGVMIEVPGAALMADRLAKEVDFFSIGTNDLVQYTMAADRMNPKLAYLSDALHPAVLRLIAQVIRAAEREGKWVGMCGEMAGQPLAVPVLLGLGLHEFSMNGLSVPRTRALLARLNREDLRPLAEAVLDLDDPSEVKRCIEVSLPWIQEFV
ncbi:phosphotransferase system, enzyme I, PtsI [Paenibacillus sp. UNCCL117]|uniref:phosphoenolpyruvate--protein phosphotransferase n=1 Tax=unclassified Paenibacillus TaxID=185978 RepID=UPI000885123C|nr:MULTISPECIES: phosphoenolpyruvate--protein phosphotransferase [unclassified Paenibacillus]SDC04985.1 phosphoenolpyruvate--protein phosphotransferase [Paenibacillus sp. cl123]SFW37461.1 phosphotransferase system, enzyme I, PtsI [Paenibacillus sp. UNCCL117]